MYYGIFYQQLIYKTFNSRSSLWYIEYQTISRTNIAIEWYLIIKNFHAKRDKNKFEKQDAKWTPWSPEISTIPKFKI